MSDEKLLEKLVQDKHFMSKIVAMSTPEEVQKAFQDKGADLTLSEIKDFGSALCMAVENKGKLPDEVLTASGGKLKTWHKLAIASGAAVALAGGVAFAGYEGYKHSPKFKSTIDGSFSKSSSQHEGNSEGKVCDINPPYKEPGSEFENNKVKLSDWLPKSSLK